MSEVYEEILFHLNEPLSLRNPISMMKVLSFFIPEARQDSVLLGPKPQTLEEQKNVMDTFLKYATKLNMKTSFSVHDLFTQEGDPKRVIQFSKELKLLLCVKIQTKEDKQVSGFILNN